ncbi:MAG: zinc ribbon domain-containing protein [Deltaproteobacteria bacterium]|jgi:ribosomal protein L40E|nr:zinc ribbon domain-containing protein [Nitrososphaeraceae archaeon]
MKVFDGRSAAEEYMSTHTLTFSTPEMTLKKFVFWLSEIVEHNGEEVPRIILFLQTKKEENEDQNQVNETSTNKSVNFSDLLPDIDETFKPTGAITDMFNKTVSSSSKNLDYPTNLELKFCIECGNKLRVDSKFCIKCGTRQ